MANITGSSGNDTLNGSSSADAINGLAGDDVLNGLAGNDTLIGGPGNDTLDGGAGADSMVGGVGDDVYFVDSASDVVVEAADEGVDTIVMTFAVFAPANVENLTYAGSQDFVGFGGNDLDNIITGNALSQTMFGFGGNDTISYAYESNPVVVNLETGQASGSGNDSLSSFENVWGGKAGDRLIGTSAENVLDGRGGADTMQGGFGNDTYYVDNALDVVVETSNSQALSLASAAVQSAAPGFAAVALQGITDTVIAAVNYSLANVAFVENLTLSEGSTATIGTGNELDNVLTGNALNNTLTGLAGNDTLDGGAGIDTAVFSGNRAASTITKIASGYTVSGLEGSDTLSNIERLQFSDKKLALDLDTGQAAGNTVRIIGAAFDAPAIQQHPDYVGIGLQLFDSGMSMQQVCQLAIGAMGSPSNVAFVTTVYTNVVGVAPSAADRDFYVGLLQGSGGTTTQADLLVLAANADVNAVNINLVGLQAGGVEFV